jgi:hypothetical protein
VRVGGWAGVAGGAALDSAGLGLGYHEMSVDGLLSQANGVANLVHHTDHEALLLDVVGSNSLVILENFALN